MEHDAGPSERIEKPRNAVCAAGGQRCGLPNNLLTYLIINLKINIYINIQYVRVYIYIYYMVRRSAAPPPSPPKGKWSGYRVGPPLPSGVGCGALFPLWGGCGVLGFRV